MSEKVITAKVCHYCQAYGDFRKMPYELKNMSHIVWSQCNQCGGYTYIRKELVFETEEQLHNAMQSVNFIDYMDLPV
jgi:hypothetical protein